MNLPIVNGVYADGSLEAARIAKMAEQGGASALLVFPPDRTPSASAPRWRSSTSSRIADATSLPLILFQYPLAGGQGYPRPRCENPDEVPSVRAIKDWCANRSCTSGRCACCSRARGRQRAHHAQLVAFPRSCWAATGCFPGSGSVIADLQAGFSVP